MQDFRSGHRAQASQNPVATMPATATGLERVQGPCLSPVHATTGLTHWSEPSNLTQYEALFASPGVTALNQLTVRGFDDDLTDSLRRLAKPGGNLPEPGRAQAAPQGGRPGRRFGRGGCHRNFMGPSDWHLDPGGR